MSERSSGFLKIKMNEFPYQLMPPLMAEEFAALKMDIAERGILVAVELDEFGNVLDGHHRLRAAAELGIPFDEIPIVVRESLSEMEKRSHARALNTHRRHLNQEQRRALIAEELLENPSLSNSLIAKRLGVSDMTVASVRRSLGDEAMSDVVLGADGKFYPAERKSAFLDEFLAEPKSTTNIAAENQSPLVPDVQDYKTNDAMSADDLVYLPEADDFVVLRYAVTPEQRDTVLRALDDVKTRKTIATSAEAIVVLCRMWLQAYELEPVETV